jgi:hypothetical protein
MRRDPSLLVCASLKLFPDPFRPTFLSEEKPNVDPGLLPIVSTVIFAISRVRDNGLSKTILNAAVELSDSDAPRVV